MTTNLVPITAVEPYQALARRIRLLTDQSGGPNACWPWLGYAQKNGGYGRLSFEGKMRTVTHLVYELDRGHPPEKPCVLHTCDNPPCVNARHLWSGTPTDNMRDMQQKGRGRQVTGDQHWMRRSPGRFRGERNGNAKLTRPQVETIRRRYARGGISQPTLARKYGVTQGTIWYILSRTTWK